MPVSPTTNADQPSLLNEFDLRVTKNLVSNMPLRFSDEWLTNGCWAIKRTRIANQSIFNCQDCLQRYTGQNAMTGIDDYAVEAMFDDDMVMERWTRTEHIIENNGIDFVRFRGDDGRIAYIRREFVDGLNLQVLYGDDPLRLWDKTELGEFTMVVAAHREPQHIRLPLATTLQASQTEDIEDEVQPINDHAWTTTDDDGDGELDDPSATIAPAPDNGEPTVRRIHTHGGYYEDIPLDGLPTFSLSNIRAGVVNEQAGVISVIQGHHTYDLPLHDARFDRFWWELNRRARAVDAELPEAVPHFEWSSEYDIDAPTFSGTPAEAEAHTALMEVVPNTMLPDADAVAPEGSFAVPRNVVITFVAGNQRLRPGVARQLVQQGELYVGQRLGESMNYVVQNVTLNYGERRINEMLRIESIDVVYNGRSVTLNNGQEGHVVIDGYTTRPETAEEEGEQPTEQTVFTFRRNDVQYRVVVMPNWDTDKHKVTISLNNRRSWSQDFTVEFFEEACDSSYRRLAELALDRALEEAA